jgi:uncharacterized protein (DUF3084 family)
MPRMDLVEIKQKELVRREEAAAAGVAAVQSAQEILVDIAAREANVAGAAKAIEERMRRLAAREAELAQHEREIEMLRRSVMTDGHDRVDDTMLYESTDLTFSEGLRVLAARTMTNPQLSERTTPH